MVTRWDVTRAVRASDLPSPSRLVTSGLPHIRLGWTRDPSLRRTGVVYYLERADGAIKIGCTSNYPQRRQALLRQYGPLSLVAWEAGYSELEKHRHEQFDRLRINPSPNQEWFAVDPELMDHLLMLLAML